MSTGAASTTSVRVELNPDPADVRAVHAGLRAFNVAHIGEPCEVPVHAFLRDAAGRVVGGLTGHVKWKWLYVQKLWVSDRFRSQGAGRQLMEAAERFARAHGATDVYLDTFEYQARPFYERLGYRLFGALEGHPPGFRQYFLTKSLQSPGATTAPRLPSPDSPP